MDAHHDQVARRRAELASAPPRRYFAYSTILDRQAFDQWRAKHGYQDFQLPAGQLGEAIDLDLVYDFPSRWWDGRVAGLINRPGARIYGLVYEIAGGDWPILEHKEGAVTGMSIERPVRVRVDGQKLTAFLEPILGSEKVSSRNGEQTKGRRNQRGGRAHLVHLGETP